MDGEKQLRRALQALPEKLQRKVARKALSKGGRLIAKEARKLVRPVSRTIAKSIAVKTKVYASGTGLAIVGPREMTGAARALRVAEVGDRFHNPSKTAHLVEGGTKPHLIPGGTTPRQHPGTEPHPFILRAGQTQGADAQRAMVAMYQEGIEQVGRELGR